MPNDQIRVIRTPRNSERPYFSMCRASAQDRELSWAARGVLAYLLSKPDDWTIQPRDLQQKCGRDKVYSILGELRRSGYLKVEKVRNDSGRISQYIYTVHEYPLPEKPEVVSEPLPEKPDTAEPDTAKPHITEYRELENRESNIIKPRSGASASGGLHYISLSSDLSHQVSTEPKERTLRKYNSEATKHQMTIDIESSLGIHFNKANLTLADASFTYMRDDESINSKSLVRMYDEEPGFSDYVIFRVKAHKEMAKGNKLDLHNLLRDMQNFARPNTGWLAWKEKNPFLTTQNTNGTHADFETPVVEFIEL